MVRACNPAESAILTEATRAVYDAQAELLVRELVETEQDRTTIRVFKQFEEMGDTGEILLSISDDTLLADPETVAFFAAIFMLPGVFEEWNKMRPAFSDHFLAIFMLPGVFEEWNRQGEVVLPSSKRELLLPALLCAVCIGVDALAYQPSSGVALRLSHHQIIELWRVDHQASSIPSR